MSCGLVGAHADTYRMTVLITNQRVRYEPESVLTAIARTRAVIHGARHDMLALPTVTFHLSATPTTRTDRDTVAVPTDATR